MHNNWNVQNEWPESWYTQHLIYLPNFIFHYLSQCLTIESKLQLKTMTKRSGSPTPVTHTHTHIHTLRITVINGVKAMISVITLNNWILFLCLSNQHWRDWWLPTAGSLRRTEIVTATTDHLTLSLHYYFSLLITWLELNCDMSFPCIHSIWVYSPHVIPTRFHK